MIKHSEPLAADRLHGSGNESNCTRKVCLQLGVFTKGMDLMYEVTNCFAWFDCVPAVEAHRLVTSLRDGGALIGVPSGRFRSAAMLWKVWSDVGNWQRSSCHMYFNCTGHWTDKRPQQRELRGKLLLHLLSHRMIPVLYLPGWRKNSQCGMEIQAPQHKPLA